MVGQDDAHPLPGFEEVSVAKGRGLQRPQNARQGHLACVPSSAEPSQGPLLGDFPTLWRCPLRLQYLLWPGRGKLSHRTCACSWQLAGGGAVGPEYEPPPFSWLSGSLSSRAAAEPLPSSLGR